VQPYSRLLFDAIDSGLWNRIAATGPRQSGKSFHCFVIPILYHLFEVKESVAVLLPDDKVIADKWTMDIKKSILKSRFAKLMPKTGGGSRGGKVDLITFDHGPSLRFFPGGSTLAGFTSRVLVVSETDEFKTGEAEVQADKIKQAEGFVRSYGDNFRVYLECITTTEKGKIHTEVQAGTASRIAIPCPHCGSWVTPEREHLLGWQDAADQAEARAKAAFYCPADGCGQRWSEDDRVAANQSARLLHKGQTVGPDGEILGDPPKVDTLGFRWSAINNLFDPVAKIAAEEWKAARDPDQDNVERERLQFVWAIPHKSDIQDMAALSVDALMVRQSEHHRGIIPVDTQLVTAAIDVGKWKLHYTVKAWTSLPRGLTIDYGQEVDYSSEMGEQLAILTALRQLRETLMAGWQHGDRIIKPRAILVDAGNWFDTICKFVLESGRPFFASKGFGLTQYVKGRYSRPNNIGKNVKFIGDSFHVARQDNGVDLVEYDADAWKSTTHSRLECSKDEVGAILLFRSEEQRPHFQYAKHLTAEKKVEEWEPGKGLQIRWEKLRKDNHWLDTESMANLAGAFAGVQVVKAVLPPPKPQKPKVDPLAALAEGRMFRLADR
jgi:phage terminase large subunit GpA-like protein